MDPTQVSVVSRCVFRGGCDIIFLVFGCLLHKWSRLFVLFFLDLTIDDGMGPKLCLMDGWEKMTCV